MNIGKIAKWLGRRMKERSTYAGAAIVASTLGAHQLGAQIGQFGEAAALIFGTGLMTSTTSKHPSIDDLTMLR